jgi:monoamine oxidase
VSELVDMGLASLAEIFDLSLDRMKRDLVTSQAINWGNDPFARGAYSYATPKTREAQLALRKPDGGAVFFSGEALYAGRDMGTVEAALPSGRGGGADDPGRRTIGGRPRLTNWRHESRRHKHCI